MKGDIFMAKAKKLPSGNWRCRATITDSDGNKVTMSFTAETAKKAEALAKMWQAGMIEQKRQRETGGITLGEAIDNYIETCRCAGMSPATVRGYKTLRKNAYKLIEKKAINKLTIQDVQRQINERAKTCSPKTLRNSLGLLSVVLKQNNVRMDLDSLRLPKREKKEMSIPSDAQVRALLDASCNDNDLYIAILLAAMMGMRRSEICALKWADVTHADAGSFISLTKAIVPDGEGHYVEKAPKTAAGRRTLPVPHAVAEQLKRRRNLCPSIITVSPGAITARFEKLSRALGIPCRFHDLRHYHASVMIREGVPEKYIVTDMGHASFDMVRNVYGHVMEEKQSEINQKMDVHASAILEEVDTKIATIKK